MSSLPAESGVATALPAGGGRRAAGGEVQIPLFGELKAAVLHDVHAVSIPARAFTGDFYFTHRYADRLWFALGDVAGKGINAAVVMAMIQEELEHRITSCAVTRCDPAVTMLRLHAFLRPSLPRNRFATAVIGQLHDDGTLVIANAGHCPPLIVRADGRIEQVGSTGPVVGILRTAQWSSIEIRLEPGDTLLLYSDGLVEAQSSTGEEFGIDGIERTLHGGTASDIAEGILGAVDRHTGGVREDDLTLVVVRR
jgi:serine phosphatase RsbU (regulator of sigma subunit)